MSLHELLQATIVDETTLKILWGSERSGYQQLYLYLFDKASGVCSILNNGNPIGDGKNWVAERYDYGPISCEYTDLSCDILDIYFLVNIQVTLFISLASACSLFVVVSWQWTGLIRLSMSPAIAIIHATRI